MKTPIKLLINHKFYLEQILHTPMSILSTIGQEEHVTWKSFESKKLEIECELKEVSNALLALDPKKEFH